MIIEKERRSDAYQRKTTNWPTCLMIPKILERNNIAHGKLVIVCHNFTKKNQDEKNEWRLNNDNNKSEESPTNLPNNLPVDTTNIVSPDNIIELDIDTNTMNWHRTFDPHKLSVNYLSSKKDNYLATKLNFQPTNHPKKYSSKETNIRAIKKID